jgi:hypothetical protein
MSQHTEHHADPGQPDEDQSVQLVDGQPCPICKEGVIEARLHVWEADADGGEAYEETDLSCPNCHDLVLPINKEVFTGHTKRIQRAQIEIGIYLLSAKERIPLT